MIRKIFFDKNCVIDRQLSDRSNLESDLKSRGINYTNIALINQIHSAEVLVIDDAAKIHGTQNLPKADAIVTNLPNLAIAVVTADCSPILLQDSSKKIIAAVHAGWRGAKANIIAAAVEKMKNLGSNPQQISADIGPMIHQKSYQISQEFYDDFIVEDKNFAKFFQEDAAPNHYLFDLPAFVTHKLKEQNITQINNVNIDTYISPDHASYRRGTHENNKEYGRNISLIVIE